MHALPWLVLTTVLWWLQEQPVPADQADGAAESQHRLLFTAQHQRLSLQQMNMFSDHVTAAEETDEDFFGNFS